MSIRARLRRASRWMIFTCLCAGFVGLIANLVAYSYRTIAADEREDERRVHQVSVASAAYGRALEEALGHTREVDKLNRSFEQLRQTLRASAEDNHEESLEVAEIVALAAQLDEVHLQAQTSLAGPRDLPAAEELAHLFFEQVEAPLQLQIEKDRLEAEAATDTAAEAATAASGLTFLALVVCAVVSALTTRSVERELAGRLEELVLGISRIAQGELLKPVKTTGTDEISAIGEALNQTCEKLLAAHKAVEAGARMSALGQLAASMGHELRNPLGAIRNAATYLTRRLAPTDPKVQSMFSLIEREVVIAAQYIEDVLDYARTRELHRTLVTLRPLVDEVLQVIGPTAERVDNQVPEDLPAMSADRTQLRQLLTNLVRNALEATNTLTAIGSVRVTARAEGASCVIVVEDDGGGIPKQVQQTLFQPLVTTKRKGTGLGLAIVSRVVEAHHGTIAIEDCTRGARFVIQLPTLEAHLV